MPELIRENAVASARSYMGVKFVHQGRDPRNGLDCIGMILCAFAANGWQPDQPSLALNTSYKRVPDSEALLAAVESECQPIALAHVRPADLLLMHWPGDERPRHLAMVTEIKLIDDKPVVYIIHVHSQVGCVTEHSLDAGWRQRVVMAYRPNCFEE